MNINRRNLIVGATAASVIPLIPSIAVANISFDDSVRNLVARYISEILFEVADEDVLHQKLEDAVRKEFNTTSSFKTYDWINEGSVYFVNPDYNDTMAKLKLSLQRGPKNTVFVSYYRDFTDQHPIYGCGTDRIQS